MTKWHTHVAHVAEHKNTVGPPSKPGAGEVTNRDRLRKCLCFTALWLCFTAFPGNAVRWQRQDFNRQSMQRVQNTWSVATDLFFNARTQM